jgi:uncharacterized protein (DUF1015 family)
MPKFRPLKALLPQKSIVEDFCIHSLNHLSPDEVQEKMQDKNNYLNILQPILNDASDWEKSLKTVRKNLDAQRENHALSEQESAFYLYEQTKTDKSKFRGIIGLTTVEDFVEGRIKSHEKVLAERQEKLAQFFDTVELQVEPVLLCYESNLKVEQIMDNEQKNVPHFNFTDEYKIKHKLWKIESRLKIKEIKESLETVGDFYIADGHHRINAVAQNSNDRKEKKKQIGTENHHHILSFLVSSQSIKIHDYNRVVTHSNGLNAEELLQKIGENYLISPKGSTPYYPSKKHHVSMYLEGQFYSLHVKHELRQESTGLDYLDHYLLEKNLLKPILGISLKASSEHINYIKGDSTVTGIKNLQKLVDTGDYKIGFGVHPVSFKELKMISDENISMPPKSTYIEPKLLTAMLLFDCKA